MEGVEAGTSGDVFLFIYFYYYFFIFRAVRVLWHIKVPRLEVE